MCGWKVQDAQQGHPALMHLEILASGKQLRREETSQTCNSQAIVREAPYAPVPAEGAEFGIASKLLLPPPWEQISM